MWSWLGDLVALGGALAACALVAYGAWLWITALEAEPPHAQGRHERAEP